MLPSKECRVSVSTGAASGTTSPLPLCQATDHSARLHCRSLMSSLPPVALLFAFSISNITFSSSAMAGFKCRHDKPVKNQLKQRPPPNSFEGFFSRLGEYSCPCDWNGAFSFHTHFSSPLLPGVFLLQGLFALAYSQMGTPSFKYASQSSAFIHLFCWSPKIWVHCSSSSKQVHSGFTSPLN